MSVTEQPPVGASAPQRIPRALGAVAGVLAAGLALGVAELVAALLGTVSPVIAVGDAFVERTPQWLKEFAIETFGENDKVVLLGGILVTVVLLAAVAGALAAGRRAVGDAVVVVLGLVAGAAAYTSATAGPLDLVPPALVVVVGVLALRFLLDRAEGRPTTGAGSTEPTSRRPFLIAVLAAALGAAVTGVISQVLRRGDASANLARSELGLPRPVDPAPALPSGTSLGVDGVAPFTTPNGEFYRIDTALTVPRMTTQEWRLRIHGMVEREIELDFDDLLSRPMVERDITIACVSNPIGGPYVGTARWLGYPLRELLAEAGVDAGADQLISTSVDGMTIGTPVGAVTDERDALLVIGMNGQPLPFEHGFPVRMIVPGLYGYVSATKWVIDMELTTFDAYDAYWTERGYAARGPIKLQSRIDTPKPLAAYDVGDTVTVAGVAWGQPVGIGAVEVRVDGADWVQAELADDGGPDLWRQWVHRFELESAGDHTVEVRATDRDGQVQPEERTEPFPDGAAGWHSVRLRAS